MCSSLQQELASGITALFEYVRVGCAVCAVPDVVGMEKSPRYSQAYCQAAPSMKSLMPSVRLVLR